MTIYKIQLFAYGEQDFYLTGNPQISFFKTVYRRHTHFSIEKGDINFRKDGGTTNFDTKFHARILRKADLLSKLFLEIDLECRTTGTTPTYTVNNFTNSLIKSAVIKIGEYKIEEYLSQWKQVRYELNNPHKSSYNFHSSEIAGGCQTEFNFVFDTNRTYIDHLDYIEGHSPVIIGGRTSLNEYIPPNVTGAQRRNFRIGYYDTVNNAYTPNPAIINKKLLYNFDFWFCRNIGLALPIVSLFNHEITLEFETEKKRNLIGDVVNINPTQFLINNIQLKGEYIHLYGDEKRRFTASSHEYLIDQVQVKESIVEQANNKTTYNINSFSHPVKAIYWVVQNTGEALAPADNNGIASTNRGMGPCYFISMTNSSLYGSDATSGTVNLKLNGYNSKKDRPIIHFTRHQPGQYCKHIPPLDRIGMYSFALNPFDFQPSGTCNMSKIKNKELELEISNNNTTIINNNKLFIFAVNYNVLKISEGLGGLLFSH